MVLAKKTVEKCKATLLFFEKWNVRSLSAKEKNEQLGRDCCAYNLDLVGIQEPKTNKA